MSRFQCSLGCRAKMGGKAWHNSQKDCPRYRANHPEEFDSTPMQQPVATAPQENAPTPPQERPAPSPPSPKMPSGPSKWTWGSTPAPIASAEQVPTMAAKASAHYLIDDEHVDTFWDTVVGLIEKACNLICAFLEIENVPKGAFDKSEAQRLMLRRSTRAGVSHTMETVFQAETPERAHELIDGFAGLVNFGGMFIIIAHHFIREVPKSPRLARDRKKREERIAKGELAPRASILSRFRRPKAPGVTESSPSPAAVGAPA